ncbi:MAG: helix-turn-helix domain-containing protein [Alphaproteobacteria bacterium]|nr:helix-turn-helix domain-containing protein [Alphaproteobacteria bacterium]
MSDSLEKRTETTGVVKSAARTLAVLEVFQNWKRPASAREIARTLEMPRSSANALLASLVTLGYLWFEPKNATYFPTLKVGLLGEWLIGSIRRDRALGSILQEVSAATGETVSIAMRAGFDMQFITIFPSTFPIALNIEEGALAPLFESAVGIAWIAGQDIGEIEDLVAAHNKRTGIKPVALADMKKRISDVGTKGAAVAYDKVLPDTGAIGLAYPRPVQGQTVVIGVAGPEDRIRRSEKQIIALIRRLVRQTLG